MPAPDLKWFSGSTAVEAPIDLAAATPGTPSTATSRDFWNDKDGSGADTAYDYALELLVRVPLTGAEINASVPPRPFVSIGHEAVNNYWFQARIVAGLGTLTVATGPWTPLGAGRWLKIPTLASGQGVTIEIRNTIPSDAQNRFVEWTFSVTRQLSRTLPIGLHESIGPGVNLGIGDDLVTQLISIAGNTVQNPGGVDQQVQIQDVAWVAAGVPY